MFDLPPPPPVAAIELRLPDAASNFNPAQPFHLSASLQTGLRASLKPSLSAPRMSSIRIAANETATDTEKPQSIEQTEAEDSQQDAEVTGRFTPGTLRDRRFYHPMNLPSQRVIWKGKKVTLTYRLATPNYDANGNIPLDISRSTLGPFKIYNGVYNLDDHVVRGIIYRRPGSPEHIAIATDLIAPYFYEIDRIWTDKGVEYKKGAFAVTPFTKFVIRNITKNRIEHVIWPQNDPQIDFDKLGFIQGDTYQLISYRRKRANQGNDQRNGVTFTITTPIDISDLKKNMVWSRPDLKYRVSGYVKITRGSTIRVTDNWPGLGEFTVKDQDRNGYAFVEFLASPSARGATHVYYITDKATKQTQPLVIPHAPPDPSWAPGLARKLQQHAARLRSQWGHIFGKDQTISGAQVRAAAKRATGANKAALEALLQHTSEGHSVFGVMAGPDFVLTPAELTHFIQITSRQVARGRYGYIVDPHKQKDLWRIAYAKELVLFDESLGKKAQTYDKEKRITRGSLSVASYLMEAQLQRNGMKKDETQIMSIIQRLTELRHTGAGVAKAAAWVGISFGYDNRRKLVRNMLKKEEMLMMMPTFAHVGGNVELRLLEFHRRNWTQQQIRAQLDQVVAAVHTHAEQMAAQFAATIAYAPGILADTPSLSEYMALENMIFKILDAAFKSPEEARKQRYNFENVMYLSFNVPRGRSRIIMDVIMMTAYMTEHAYIRDETARDDIVRNFYNRHPTHINATIVTMPDGTMQMGLPEPEIALTRAFGSDELR